VPQRFFRRALGFLNHVDTVIKGMASRSVSGSRRNGVAGRRRRSRRFLLFDVFPTVEG